MFRKITLLLGLAGICFGLYSALETAHFLSVASPIIAEIRGYSSFQKLERISGACSAYRKGCEIDIAYTIPGTSAVITAGIPQPIFSRTKGTELSILVDPSDPLHPQIAALHMLFRNAMVTFFLGVMILFVRWLLGMKPRIS